MDDILIGALGLEFKSLATLLDHLQLDSVSRTKLNTCRYSCIEFDKFLRETIVHLPKELTTPLDATRHSSFLDLLHRSINLHLERSRFRPPSTANLLSMGYRSIRGTHSAGRLSGAQTVENFYPNFLVNVHWMGRGWWERLWMIVGDELIWEILDSAIVLVKNSQDWTQISGVPLSERLYGKKTDSKREGRIIERYRMYYGDSSRQARNGETISFGLPFAHLLNKRASSTKIDTLTNVIFYGSEEKDNVNGKSKIWKSSRLFSSNLIKRHKKCPYKSLINYHCPDLSSCVASKLEGGGSIPNDFRSSPWKNVQSHRRVFAFVKAVVGRLLGLRKGSLNFLWKSKNLDLSQIVFL